MLSLYLALLLCCAAFGVVCGLLWEQLRPRRAWAALWRVGRLELVVGYRLTTD